MERKDEHKIMDCNMNSISFFDASCISRVNELFEDYILNECFTLEDKVEASIDKKIHTSTPQSAIIKIASAVTGRTDGEIFAEAVNNLSTKIKVSVGTQNRNGISTICVTERPNVFTIGNQGFKYERRSRVLESIGASKVVWGVPVTKVQVACEYLNILDNQHPTISCSFSGLVEMMTLHYSD